MQVRSINKNYEVFVFDAKKSIYERLSEVVALEFNDKEAIDYFYSFNILYKSPTEEDKAQVKKAVAYFNKVFSTYGISKEAETEFTADLSVFGVITQVQYNKLLEALDSSSLSKTRRKPVLSSFDATPIAQKMEINFVPFGKIEFKNHSSKLKSTSKKAKTTQTGIREKKKWIVKKPDTLKHSRKPINEIIAQEVLRFLLDPNPTTERIQPKTRALRCSDGSNYTISEQVNFQPIADIKNFKKLVEQHVITGIGSVAVAALITGDSDRHGYNMGINSKNQLVTIDGDNSFNEIHITPEIIQDLPYISPQSTFYPYNWFNLIIGQKRQHPTYELVSPAMAHDPKIRAEINFTILCFLLLPDSLFQEFIQNYTTDLLEIIKYAKYFTDRQENFLKAASQIPNFRQFVASDEAEKKLTHYLEDIQHFRPAKHHYIIDATTISVIRKKFLHLKEGLKVEDAFLACATGDARGLSKLIEQKVNLSKTNQQNNFTAAHYVIYSSAEAALQKECLQLLIKENVNFDSVFDSCGFSPFQYAVYLGRNELVKILIDNKVDVNIGTALKNSTPLMYAAHNGNIECMKYLIEAKANIHHIDNNRSVALYNALISDKTDAFYFLLKSGAFPAPALNYAVMLHKHTIVEDLLSTYKVVPDYAAIQLALDLKNFDIISLFLKHGIDFSSPDFVSRNQESDNFLYLIRLKKFIEKYPWKDELPQEASKHLKWITAAEEKNNWVETYNSVTKVRYEYKIDIDKTENPDEIFYNKILHYRSSEIGEKLSKILLASRLMQSLHNLIEEKTINTIVELNSGEDFFIKKLAEKKYSLGSALKITNAANINTQEPALEATDSIAVIASTLDQDILDNPSLVKSQLNHLTLMPNLHTLIVNSWFSKSLPLETLKQMGFKIQEDSSLSYDTPYGVALKPLTETEIVERTLKNMQSTNILNVSYSKDPHKLLTHPDITEYIREAKSSLTIDLSYCKISKNLLRNIIVTFPHHNIKWKCNHWDEDQLYKLLCQAYSLSIPFDDIDTEFVYLNYLTYKEPLTAEVQLGNQLEEIIRTTIVAQIMMLHGSIAKSQFMNQQFKKLISLCQKSGSFILDIDFQKNLFSAFFLLGKEPKKMMIEINKCCSKALSIKLINLLNKPFSIDHKHLLYVIKYVNPRLFSKKIKPSFFPGPSNNKTLTTETKEASAPSIKIIHWEDICSDMPGDRGRSKGRWVKSKGNRYFQKIDSTTEIANLELEIKTPLGYDCQTETLPATYSNQMIEPLVLGGTCLFEALAAELANTYFKGITPPVALSFDDTGKAAILTREVKSVDVLQQSNNLQMVLRLFVIIIVDILSGNKDRTIENIVGQGARTQRIDFLPFNQKSIKGEECLFTMDRLINPFNLIQQLGSRNGENIEKIYQFLLPTISNHFIDCQEYILQSLLTIRKNIFDKSAINARKLLLKEFTPSIGEKNSAYVRDFLHTQEKSLLTVLEEFDRNSSPYLFSLFPDIMDKLSEERDKEELETYIPIADGVLPHVRSSP